MLLSGVKSAKPGCPCLAVAILCAVVGLAGGWGSSGLWGPGQPSGASFRGAEWGIRGELSQEALHKACIGHSCWACHPGVCPQGWGGEEVKNKGARGSIWGERQHCFLNVVVVVTQLSVKTLKRMSFTGCK